MEIWKIIEDFDLYEVSNYGRIKALNKYIHYIDGRIRFYPETILRPRLDGKKYHFVTLHRKYYKIQLRVHRLVAEAFILNPENKPCVNHKDGNRMNNNVENLEWATYRENTADGIRRGTICKPGKKISLAEVNQIRWLYKSGQFTQYEIAVKFNLTQRQISRIINFKNWK